MSASLPILTGLLGADVHAAEEKTHSELITSNRHEYTITMGGAMDGPMTRSPVGYLVWDQAFEPNVSVRVENIGEADVVNPWVVVNGKGNWRPVEDMVAEATAGCETEKDKAMAIYQFLIRHRFHRTTGDAENHDVVKALNVYGHSLCGNTAVMIQDLWRTAGLKVRRSYLQGHEVAEVFYEGKYHLFDADENIFCLLRDNETVAGEAHVVRDHDLIKRTHTYGINCDDSRGDDEYSASFYVYEGHREGEEPSRARHRMHFTLRPGEALEWRWRGEGLYHGRKDLRGNEKILARLANGRMFYRPRLPPASRQNGTTWEIRSPYVIAGGRVRAEFTRPAGVSACRLLMSFDGKSWKEILSAGERGGRREADLAEEFPHDGRARYGYSVKVEGRGRAGLKEVEFESVLQMAPLSLPALELGKNRILYVAAAGTPHKVRVTHTWKERSAPRPPQAPPGPKYPPDRATIKRTRFSFEWAVPGDPDGDRVTDYRFQLSSRADMRWPLSPNFDKWISRTRDRRQARYTLPCDGLLNPGQEYYWRVRARDAEGLWGPWSETWSFTMPRGPRAPRFIYKWQPNYRCDRPDRARRTLTLRWKPDPRGARPVKYRVYGSDEKGFTVSDKPYKVLWRRIQKQAGLEGDFRREMKEFPANFVCETDRAELTVVGPDVRLPNANKAYYRVVAVGANGIESVPSDYAAVRRPFIYSLPTTEVRPGAEWSYQPRVIASIGDLRCRDFVPEEYSYNAYFWDQEVPRFDVVNAPSWVRIDESTGLVTGTPGNGDVGRHRFMIYVNIPRVGCDSQIVDLKVRK